MSLGLSRYISFEVFDLTGGREIMIRRIRVFHRTDVGSILMQAGDNDLNSLFNRGAVFLRKNVRVGYWIYSLFRCFLMLELAMLGNLLLNKARSMVEVKVSLLEA